LDRPREALECYETVLENQPDLREHGHDGWDRLKRTLRKQ